MGRTLPRTTHPEGVLVSNRLTYCFYFDITFESYITDSEETRSIKHFMTTESEVREFPHRTLVELVFGEGTRILYIDGHRVSTDDDHYPSDGTRLFRLQPEDKEQFFPGQCVCFILDETDKLDTRGDYIVSPKGRLIGKVLRISIGNAHWPSDTPAPRHFTS